MLPSFLVIVTTPSLVLKVAPVINVFVSVTVSVAVVIPVMCPKLSNKISCMYVLPELFEEDAALTEGCAVKYVLESTLPSAFKNCEDVPPIFLNWLAFTNPPFSK